MTMEKMKAARVLEPRQQCTRETNHRAGGMAPVTQPSRTYQPARRQYSERELGLTFAAAVILTACAFAPFLSHATH
jgi:hypothetical protein